MRTRNHQHLPSGTRIKYWRAGVDRSGGLNWHLLMVDRRARKNKVAGLDPQWCSVSSGDEHKKVVTFFKGVAWIVVMGRFVQALELMRPPSEREDRHMTLQSKWPIGTERFTEAEESTDFSGMHIP